MNEKLKEFLENAKAEEKSKRDAHLISLGLTDDNKTARKYMNYFTENAQYDEEKKLYYRETTGAIDVTDEEYTEICKYSNPQPTAKSKGVAENTISIIANIALIGGFILSFVLICLCFMGGDDALFLIIMAVVVIISSLISWGLLKIFCNISSKLTDIENKLK